MLNQKPKSLEHFQIATLIDHGFTVKQARVIFMIKEGFSIQEISDQNRIKYRTVVQMLTTIYEKLNLPKDKRYKTLDLIIFCANLFSCNKNQKS